MSEEDQNQRIQELFLLQRVAQRINSILDLDVLLEEIVNDVAQTFGYSRSAVLLKDETTNEVVIAAVRGWTINYHLKGERFKIGEYGMVGHVAATEETYYAPDVTVDPYYETSEALTRSELDIPLKIHGRLIGVFNAQHNEFNAFSSILVWSSIRMELRKRQIRRLKNTVRRAFKAICPTRQHPCAACWPMFVYLRKVIPPQMTLRW